MTTGGTLAGGTDAVGEIRSRELPACGPSRVHIGIVGYETFRLRRRNLDQSNVGKCNHVTDCWITEALHPTAASLGHIPLDDRAAVYIVGRHSSPRR
jgi:hypothetical protein